jgi:origin recognition complex subunit 1
MQEERDGREQEEVEGETWVQEPQVQEETVFYTQFTMKRPRVNPPRAKQSASGEEVLTFRVGDAITVETDTLYRQRRPPSVAIIVSMWEVKKMGEDAAECDSSKMRLRVHWFLRPSELAAIREKRDHEEVRVIRVCARRPKLSSVCRMKYTTP